MREAKSNTGSMSTKSRVTSLIDQSSRQYLENKIVNYIEHHSVDFSQRRLRDNVLIKLLDENAFIAEEDSAISELDEGDEGEELDDVPALINY